MGRPLVSIVTPVLNRVTATSRCLASIAGQTYSPIEHIVVDGGSTDGTIDLLRNHRPPHSFRWISESDKGMYEAINKGIKMAQGDVFAYLNSDDLYLPWSVEAGVGALTPGTDLVYGDLGLLRPRPGGKPASFNIQFYPDFDLRHYSFIGTIGQPTVFWRRSLTERIGLFNTRYRLIGDCEYWLRAALAGARLRHVSEIMAVQVEHASTLRETQKARLDEEFKVLRRDMSRYVDPPTLPRLARLKRSLAWRARILEFLYAMRTPHPRKWRQFVTMLRADGVEVSFRDLDVLAPARWRRGATLFGGGPIQGLLIGEGE